EKCNAAVRSRDRSFPGRRIGAALPAPSRPVAGMPTAQWRRLLGRYCARQGTDPIDAFATGEDDAGVGVFHRLLRMGPQGWARPHRGQTGVHDPRGRRSSLVDGRRADRDRAARHNDHAGQALLFALRVIPQITPLYGGVLMNSEGGAGADGTYGKPARWCGYHGKTAGDAVEGLAIMDHPENPWAPCPWFTCDYGHLSPSPFAFIRQPWT